MKEASIIIPMEKTHIREVLEIERLTFSDPWSENAFIKCLKDVNCHYFTALFENKVIGYAGYWGVLDEAQIYNVAVAESYRNKGIGKMLLNKLIAFALKEDGRKRFLLEVRAGNISAIRLYEGLGFKKDGIRPKFYSNPEEDAVLMSLTFD